MTSQFLYMCIPEEPVITIHSFTHSISFFNFFLSHTLCARMNTHLFNVDVHIYIVFFLCHFRFILTIYVWFARASIYYFSFTIKFILVQTIPCKNFFLNVPGGRVEIPY